MSFTPGWSVTAADGRFWHFPAHPSVERLDRSDRFVLGDLCRVGPGNFTPSPSQIPDLTLSRHPARATARRLPPSIEHRVPPVAG
jgi:hypothetical protein